MKMVFFDLDSFIMKGCGFLESGMILMLNIFFSISNVVR